MSTDTAYRVTETHEVKVEPGTKPKRGKRFLKWLDSMGESIRSGATRAKNAVQRGVTRVWNATKTAAATTVDWIKRGASATGRGAKWVGSKLYWSGSAVGRGLGKAARFLGRSALTFVRAIPKFLVRTTGWMARSVSWVFRTVLDTLFTVSLAAFLLAALLMALFAWMHDAYQRKVHKHAVAWSRSEYRGDEQDYPSNEEWAAKARKAVYESRAITEGETKTEITRSTEVSDAGDIVVEEKIEHVVDPEDEDDKPLYKAWFSHEVPVSMEASDEEIWHTLKDLSLMTTKRHLLSGTVESEWDHPIIQDERGKDLTDDEVYAGKSYWDGRERGHMLFIEAVGDTRITDDEYADHSTWVTTIRNKVQHLRALLEQKPWFEEERAAKTLNLKAWREGFNDQVKWELIRDKKYRAYAHRDEALIALERFNMAKEAADRKRHRHERTDEEIKADEEKEKPTAKKTAAKKASAKKTSAGKS